MDDFGESAAHLIGRLGLVGKIVERAGRGTSKVRRGARLPRNMLLKIGTQGGS